MLGRTRRVHFVGIGGIGMSGIAELLANLGYAVSGSDEKLSPVTARLATLGIRILQGHEEANVGEADVVVVSSAVRPTNPEVREAARRQIPVIPRAEMLAELMRLRFSVAVAGSHGKTTTTSMIALVLERAGLDPTAVIGGRLSAFGSNARLGRGELMVAEADESDRSFLKLFPTIAVMTNIDHEHLENYGGFDDLQQAFVDFANKVPFYGAVIACVDDPNLASILPRVTRRVTTYGLDHDADVSASAVELAPFSAKATVKGLGDLSLNVPGRHNLQNALAAVAVGIELGLSFDRIARGLEEFRGAERRFEIKGEPNGILVVDDYGHHPTEIAAVIAAARTLRRRIVVAFQPHRYTRTAALMADFGPSLAGADDVVLTDIYSAGEDAIPGVTIDALADHVRRSVGAPVRIARDLGDVVETVVGIARPGDVVLTLGAGSIGSVASKIVDALEQRAPVRHDRGAKA
ncbi:MAG TPA: UDP-N-acetylmuramate--L-alanine ligase [Vicinamibacterales bacterium]|nr:UDP-N-acetylmuramate--L-alanine ligase [Vicinamibacterales bacterium]